MWGELVYKLILAIILISMFALMIYALIKSKNE